MSKHTPGPWKIEGSAVDALVILAADERSVAVVTSHRSDDDQQANARLIAAAPDLLAALNSIATVGIHEIHDWRAVASRMQKTALSAIAKAEGK